MKRILFTAVLLLFPILGSLAAEDIKIPQRLFYVQSSGALGTDKGFWDLPGYKPKFNKGANLGLFEKETGSVWDRLYMFRSVGNGWYNIIPANGGVLDVAGGKTDNGTNVCVWESHGGNNQKFRLKYMGGDKFKIYTYSGRVLATSGRSIENDTNVHIWEDHDIPATAWYLIERSSGKPFHVKEPVQPFGQILDSKTGKPVEGASVTIINTNDKKDKSYLKKTDTNGNFRFDALPSVKYGYNITISADGYGSASIASHSQLSNGPHNVKLTSTRGLKNVEYGRFGTWLYEKKLMPGISDDYFGTNSYYAYIDGKIDSNDSFYFPDNKNRSTAVNGLMKKMGLDDTKEERDEEIYEQLKKVWEFWRTETRAVGLKNRKPLDEKAWNDLYLPSPLKRWPSVEEYAEVYDEHGFIPLGNCSSHTMGLGALMSLTGISPDKMALEGMHMTQQVTGEHWAFLVRLKGYWFWIDPQERRYSLKSLEKFQSIPAKTSYASYDKPFKIVPFPGASLSGVPLCGWKVKPLRETGVYWDPSSEHLRYANIKFSGTEPFWSLHMNQKDKFYFKKGPGFPQEEYRIIKSRYTGKKFEITGEHTEKAPWMTDGTLYLVIEKKPSSDGMSDKVYPYKATVYSGWTEYNGVGFEPELK